MSDHARDEIGRAEATERARDYAARHLHGLGDRRWRATRFATGWLLNAEGDDLEWRTGVPCIIVLDDGSVHQDSSSLPPSMLFAKYGSGGGPVDADPG